MRFALVLGLIGLVAGCSPMVAAPDDAVSGDDAATDSQSQNPSDASSDAAAPMPAEMQALFDAHCGGYCHSGGTQEAGALIVARESSRAIDLTVASRQVPRLRVIAPGDPENSYLMHKIDGTMSSLAECRADAMRCGVAMPWHDSTMPTLSSNDRALVRAWIAAGAPGAVMP